jgi:hypothetical protein
MILPRTCKSSSQMPADRPDAPLAIEVVPADFGAESCSTKQNDCRQF